MRPLLLAPALLLIAAATPNWSATVTQAGSGAFVLGNPKAKVRLVEYLSYTCSHCAHFVGEASVPLKKSYVAKGQVSVELRNAVRDQFDFAAALLARCGGGAKVFGNTEAIMAKQDVWLGKASGFVEANSDKMRTMPINAQLKLITRGVGLDSIMKMRGYTPAQLDACLTSKADQDAIAGMTNEAWSIRKITGTPAFLVNGTALTAGNWAAVEPAIKAATVAR